MNEKNDRMIDSNKLSVNRQNRYKKLHKPKTQVRKNNKNVHPAISIRVEQGIKFQFLFDVKRNGLSKKYYLSFLINNDHFNIEKISQDAYSGGQKSMESQLAQKYQDGNHVGTVANAKKISIDATKNGKKEQHSTPGVANWESGCRNMKAIERGT